MDDEMKYFFCFWGGILFMAHTIIFAFLLSAVHQNRKDINKIKESIETISKKLDENK